MSCLFTSFTRMNQTLQIEERAYVHNTSKKTLRTTFGKSRKLFIKVKHAKSQNDYPNPQSCAIQSPFRKGCTDFLQQCKQDWNAI